MPTNEEVYEKILEGERLSKPKNAPSKLYELMLDCSSPNPDSRPDFSQILSSLHAVQEFQPNEESLTNYEEQVISTDINGSYI